jgi:hypothetical protein
MSRTAKTEPRPLRSLKSIVPSVENSGVMSGKANRNASVVIEQTSVDGSPVSYSTGGQGPTLLLLHGWGLGHHAYRPALEHLVAAGYHVVAPALPGFGGTADLGQDRSFDALPSPWDYVMRLWLGIPSVAGSLFASASMTLSWCRGWCFAIPWEPRGDELQDPTVLSFTRCRSGRCGAGASTFRAT